MLTQEDKTEIQKIALRELLLVGAKIADHVTDNESDAKRVGELLVHFVGVRTDEISKGDLNRPE